MPSCDEEGCWRRALRLAEVVDDNGDNNDVIGGLRWCDLELMTTVVGTASFGRDGLDDWADGKEWGSRFRILVSLFVSNLGLCWVIEAVGLVRLRTELGRSLVMWGFGRRDRAGFGRQKGLNGAAKILRKWWGNNEFKSGYLDGQSKQQSENGSLL
ncbi:hypothetical protein MRB53_034953 [Persea americana]|uniref:Uncharacterized protein n=1 Tax=Persea americana TaxID=3435 RepID=A0ACC2K394_PERAE|nr:hypothetical protein MRB53_034953 [Persea americana]